MTEQDGPAPRRALPPRDEGDDSGAVDDAAAAKRGLWSATGASASSREGTPIPPPAVLPSSDVPPASAGRRFSAVDLPEDAERPLPRRSALSPAATRAQSPTSADVPPAAASAAIGGDADPGSARRTRRTGWIIGLVAALVAVAVAIGALWQNPFGWSLPGATPTPTIDPVATYLLQSADLDAVRADTTWDVAATATTVDATTPAAKCLVPVLEQELEPTSTLVRTFAPTDGSAGAILHQVETYATAEDATTAYAERTSQLGECLRNTAWAQQGWTITGLADESVGSLLVLQGAENEYHTILLSRTGTRLNIVDATQAAEGVPATSLLASLGAVSTRQCAAGEDGTCPTSPTATDGVPPVAAPAGYLAGVDLPRITAGAGTWRGTPVADAVTTTGSRCEAVDLTQDQGASAVQQRTLVLQEDAAAPQGFGVDEVVFTFATAEEASTFAGTLTTNIDQCADRTVTAAVARTTDLSGAGTGAAWVVTQKVDQSDNTVRFRVAALASGTRVVYLMANPSATYDFSDEAFAQVAQRSAERLSQLP